MIVCIGFCKIRAVKKDELMSTVVFSFINVLFCFVKKSLFLQNRVLNICFTDYIKAFGTLPI